MSEWTFRVNTNGTRFDQMNPAPAASPQHWAESPAEAAAFIDKRKAAAKADQDKRDALVKRAEELRGLRELNRLEIEVAQLERRKKIADHLAREVLIPIGQSQDNGRRIEARQPATIAQNLLENKKLTPEERKDLTESFELADFALSAYAEVINRYSEGGVMPYPITSATDRLWGHNPPFWRNEVQLGIWRARARLLLNMVPNAEGLLNGLKNFVIHKGFTWEIKPKKGVFVVKEQQEAGQRVLNEFLKNDNWPLKEQEAFRRSRRDGEAFIRVFCDDDGCTYTRFVEPEQVFPGPETRGDQAYSYGILTDRDDVCTVISYSVSYAAPGGHAEEGQNEPVPAKYIVHFKCNVDDNIKRGQSDFCFGTADLFELTMKLQKNLGQGASVQAAIAVIRQFETATEAQVLELSAGATDYSQTDPTNGRATDYQRIEGGSQLDIPKGMEFVSPPAGSPGAQTHLEILKSMLRSAGARHNAPEWLCSGDASNNNFASSLTAESPFVKNCETLQAWYDSHFRRVMELVIEHAINHGKLADYFLDLFDIVATYPQVQTRNKQEDATANDTYLRNKVKSPQMVAGELGIDFDQNRKDWEEYEKEMGGVGGGQLPTGPQGAFGQQMPPGLPAPGDDDEDEDGGQDWGKLDPKGPPTLKEWQESNPAARYRLWDLTEGRWVTIGASKGEGESKAHGGAHVFIDDDGRIVMGPKHMQGHRPDELGDGKTKRQGEMFGRGGKAADEAKPTPPKEPEKAKEPATPKGELPDHIHSAIKGHVDRLKKIHGEVSHTHRHFGAGESAIHLARHKEEIANSHDMIDEFKKHAPGNGVDADKVLNDLGGIPDMKDFDSKEPARPKPAAAPTPTPAPAAKQTFTKAGDEFKAREGTRLPWPDMVVKKIEGDSATIAAKGHEDSHKKTIPTASLDHFRQEMQGRIESDKPSGNKHVDAILNGKGELLGHGNDGLAFDAGDKVVKAGTVTPYHPLSGGSYHHPEGAKTRIKEQIQNNNEMVKAGVPNLLTQDHHEHDGRGFAIMDKVDTKAPVTKEHLDQIAQAIKTMHEKGFSLNDEIQFGLDKNGTPRIFDTGSAEKLPAEGMSREDRISGDHRQLERIFDQHGIKSDYLAHRAKQNDYDFYDGRLLDAEKHMKENGDAFTQENAENSLKRIESGAQHMLARSHDQSEIDFHTDSDIIRDLEAKAGRKMKPIKSKLETPEQPAKDPAKQSAKQPAQKAPEQAAKQGREIDLGNGFTANSPHPQKKQTPAERKAEKERIAKGIAKSREASKTGPVDNSGIDLTDTSEPAAKPSTPREAAAAATEEAKTDYAFARKSAIGNFGEDLKGSARHKRNEWRSLEDAEKNGTASEMVTRDNLLKAEPTKLSATATPENSLGHLAAHFALKSFPTKPWQEKDFAEAKRYNGPDGQPAVVDPVKLRKQYYDAFKQIKAKAEELALKHNDSRLVSGQLKAEVQGIIHKLRGYEKGQNGNPGKINDYFNPVAKSLEDYTKSGLSAYKKNGVDSRVKEFSKHLDEKYKAGHDGTPESLQRIREAAHAHVMDVMDGDSLATTFGKEKGPDDRYNEALEYVSKAERTGGRAIPSKTPKDTVAHLEKTVGLRGLQYGNSVTDEERKHHLTKSAEALSDLADTIGLSDKDMSLGGKLGWAIGARGKGKALAHYEPGSKVINLTRANGVGTIAHEWGHAFDHSLSSSDYKKGGMDNYLSQTAKHRKGTAGAHAAMSDIHEAFKTSGYAERLRGELQKRVNAGQISEKKANEYWLSPQEMFARSFERHIQDKMEAAGTKNSYLTGLDMTKKPGLWPSKEETAHLAPHFEKLFAAHAKTKKGTPLAEGKGTWKPKHDKKGQFTGNGGSGGKGGNRKGKKNATPSGAKGKRWGEISPPKPPSKAIQTAKRVGKGIGSALLRGAKAAGKLIGRGAKTVAKATGKAASATGKAIAKTKIGRELAQSGKDIKNDTRRAKTIVKGTFKKIGRALTRHAQGNLKRWNMEGAQPIDPMDMAFTRDLVEDRWVTIGAHGGEGGKKKGGVPVQISDKGKILKGPKHMIGRKPNQLDVAFSQGHTPAASHEEIHKTAKKLKGTRKLGELHAKLGSLGHRELKDFAMKNGLRTPVGKKELVRSIAKQMTTDLQGKKGLQREARSQDVHPKAVEDMAGQIHAGNLDHHRLEMTVRKELSSAHQSFNKQRLPSFKALEGKDATALKSYDVILDHLRKSPETRDWFSGKDRSEAETELHRLASSKPPAAPDRNAARAEALEMLRENPEAKYRRKGMGAGKGGGDFDVF